MTSDSEDTQTTDDAGLVVDELDLLPDEEPLAQTLAAGREAMA